MPNFQSALQTFALQLTTSFSTGIAAQNEDQLKAPILNLLQADWFFNHQVVGKTEAQVTGLGGRPDLGIAVDGLL